jgi:hypothetical protein
MNRLLSSRRRRRRAGWIGSLVALAGVLTFVGVHWSNTGRDLKSSFTNEPVQTVAANPQSMPFAGDERDQVRQVAAHFVATAVVRRHLDQSWELTAPALRKGFTRAQWLSGEIPVVPYPAEAVALVKSKLDYSYAGRVGLRVAIFPKAGFKVRAQTFEIELQNLGGQAHPRWLVSYWAPAGGQGIPNQPADPSGRPVTYSAPKGIGAIWLLVPVALIAGSIIVLLLSLAIRGRLRRARAERAYSSSSSPS